MGIASLFSRDMFDDSLLKLKVINRNPQMPFPLHTHDFAELVIVYDGSGTHFTEGSGYRIEPGDVFVIEGGFNHGYRDIGNLRLYNILFSPDILKHLFLDIRSMPGYHAIFTMEPRFRQQHAFESKLRLSSRQLQHTIQIVARMEKELEQPKKGHGNRAMALACFIELIVFLSRVYNDRKMDSSGDIMRMSDIIAFMETHLDTSVTVDELASIAGMSPSTLHRMFMKTLGLPPIDYHIRMRIERAAGLVRNSRLSITEIAEATGFNDSNYFSRQFRRKMGVSPREYKKSTARNRTPDDASEE